MSQRKANRDEHLKKLETMRCAKGGSININPANKGKLHAALGVSGDKKIPLKKIEKAAHSKNPSLKKMAVFAENARHFKH